MFHTLTNDYLDVQVWDLDPTAGRGPFVVVQAGYAPGDEVMTEGFFLLRRDGRWIDIAYYLTNPDPKSLDEAVFDSTAEVMKLFGQLPPKAEVVATRIDQESLKKWYGDHPTVTPGLPELRRWITGYQQRKKQAESPPK